MANTAEIYYWEGSSNDGAYEVRSDRNFATKEECYNDMRNAVLDKMKWNTNYDEDFEGERKTLTSPFIPHETDNNCVSYEVRFYPHKITHDSFSGFYTYEIKEEKSFQAEFDEIWKDRVDHFDDFIMNIPYIHANLWVTDCDSDYNLWADWFEKSYKADCVEDTFVSCDICFPTNNVKWSQEKEDYISSKLNLEPYDNQGTAEVFWRIDSLNADELKWLEETLSDINDALTPIVCNKFELMEIKNNIQKMMIDDPKLNACEQMIEDIFEKNGVLD